MTTATGPEAGYVFSNRFDGERDRLRRLSALFDDVTLPLLERLGVQPGWGCLEAGAGEGSVARWLSERVGPSGRVVATDVDPRFLAAGPNLEVLRHDITCDPLPEAAFDLAHARLLLEHLPAREAGLARLAAALRPGGWLLVEDFDWCSANPVSALGSTLIRRVIDATVEYMGTAGYDHHYGRLLPAELARLGLHDVDATGRAFLVRGGTVDNAWFRVSMQQLGGPLTAAGALSGDDLADTFTLLDDPRFCFFSPTLVSAWGRRSE